MDSDSSECDEQGISGQSNFEDNGDDDYDNTNDISASLSDMNSNSYNSTRNQDN